MTVLPFEILLASFIKHIIKCLVWFEVFFLERDYTSLGKLKKKSKIRIRMYHIRVFQSKIVWYKIIKITYIAYPTNSMMWLCVASCNQSMAVMYTNLRRWCVHGRDA